MEQTSEIAMEEFYAECDEVIHRVGDNLKSAATHDVDVIDSIYRDIHTLKGSAFLFSFQDLGGVAHAMETSLEPVRRLHSKISPDVLENLYRSLDLIEKMLIQIRGKNYDPANFREEIARTVTSLIESSALAFGDQFVLERDPLLEMSMSADLGLAKPEKTNDDKISLSSKKTEQEKSPQPIAEVKAVVQEAATVSLNANSMSMQPPASAPSAAASVSSSLSGSGGGGSAPGGRDEGAHVADSNTTIRVSVALLDRLMNLVGEMVLARNQVLQYSQKSEDMQFLALSQKVDLVTSELQEEVMKTRMQPIGDVLNKFNRVVRDLARDLNKQIDLTISGAETELDRTLIEAIKDPLTHIIRNACDHGLETPAERKSAGKNPVGRVAVRSQQESGQVIIEISDDGRGLDTKKILQKAVDKGIITPDRAATMAERDVFQLIFAPGFSTAQSISTVSGRGVGMDVVKTNIERIGGTVELSSKLGHGATIRLRIPLTLAIVPALLVKSCGERFAIPQVKLAELVRVEAGEDKQKVEYLQGQPVFRLRGNLLPLVSLNEILTKGSESEFTIADQSNFNIVVLTTDTGAFGLVVDEILDTADIVVKPMAGFFKKLRLYSGAAIMGDGGVALILDIMGLAQRLSLTQADRRLRSGRESAVVTQAELRKDHQELLSFQLKGEGRFAVPLCYVHRLEEFAPEDLEYAGDQAIVQYRNDVLPLLSLNERMGFTKPGTKIPRAASHVIVVTRRGRLFGLLVDQIEDIYTTDKEITDPVKDIPGVLGTSIIDSEVFTVLNVYDVLEVMVGKDEAATRIEKSFAPVKASAPVAVTDGHKALNVLLAEDTSFFVRQVTRALTSRGMKVTHAEDGAKAYQILDNSNPGEFDLIVSDIEMPNLNGFDLAARVRQHPKHSSIPMIALTMRFRESDREHGAQVGFNKYLEKLKVDDLMEAIAEVTKRAV